MSAEVILSNLLVKLGLANESQLAMLVAPGETGPIKKLSQLRNTTEATTILEVADALKLEFYDFANPEIINKLKVSTFSKNVDVEFCKRHKMVPLVEDSGGIITAFANPLDEEARRVAEFALAKPIIPVIAEEGKILDLIERHLVKEEISSGDMDMEGGSDHQIEIKVDGKSEFDIKGFNTIQICSKILTDAVRCGASDIHFEPTQLGIEIRYRVDGVMSKVGNYPIELLPYLVTRFKILCNMNISERRRPQDGRLNIKIGKESVDMRVSSLPNSLGEKLVFRLLRSGSLGLSFPEIGFNEQMEYKVVNQLMSTGKIILVTGPTGSGKTTTLYTCLKFCIDGKTNIQTVEDPVEYQIAGINQVQINKEINMTFASALRSILRQDPDIIMIGEIRDAETAGIAFQAADTGHLVLSTLHTNTATSAITRLQNLGVEAFQIASSLGGVMAQRLVRKVCKKCSVPASEEYLSQYSAWMDSPVLSGQKKLMMNQGCPECNNSGFKGRAGFYSFLELTSTVQDLIYQNAPINLIAQAAQREGYVELHDAALHLVRDGITTFEEVVPYLPTPTMVKTSAFVMPGISAGYQDANRVSTVAVPQVQKSPSEASRLSKPKILMVEDNVNLRKIMNQVLTKQMYEVYEAEDGLQGLEKVYEVSPDIILCDLNMPRMGGKEFVVKMKNNPQTKHIPIIMLTDADMEDNEVNLLEVGADDFMSKSSSYKLILARLARMQNKN